ncbi:MAG TPA: ATP-binding cassette domain-containing protein [Verrucomicrobiae bacterium]|jgi:iron complex transport system ATP-binding protein|nr:ATP-binding cassette domain-containing protein [Verrucomicrobiae bacterium]
MSILSVSELTIRRDRTLILDRLSWAVHPGEQWVILGPNGSGKTSLLSALTGYLTPTSGEVDVLGQRYGRSDWRELRQRIGMVSSAVRQLIPEEEPSLETVIGGRYAMIGYWGRIRAADRRRALDLLQNMGCEALAQRPWLYLSQGERQRILIARALMAEPALLILDEPCAGLDPVAREQFLNFLQTLGARAAAPALALVTHHVEEIMPVFSHILLLRAGRVAAQGIKKTVLNSRNLSETFGAPLRLRARQGRYSLGLVAS